MLKPAPLTFTNARQLVEAALSLMYFHEDEDGPAAIPFTWVPGNDPMVVVTGENAGGKSFFRRILSQIARDNKVESMPISMEGRRNISAAPWLTMVYGDEHTEATGVNSIHTVVTGISTCKNRDTDHVVIWDEPDIGLSEGNAASVGRAFAKFMATPPEHTKASVVITHRKALVNELLGVNPHYLFLGSAEAPPTLADWVKAPPVVRDLQEVLEDSHKRFRAIQNVLDSLKTKK